MPLDSLSGGGLVRRYPRRQVTGFTLVELVVAIVVLSIGMTTFLTLVLQSTRDNPDALLQEQGYAAAQSYMEEILTQPFCDPDFSRDCHADCTSSACSACTGSEAGRANFDDVCDYDGLFDDGAADFNGAIAGLESYNVDVSVVDSNVSLNGLSAGSGQVVRVDVNVTHDGFTDLDVTLRAFKVNF